MVDKKSSSIESLPVEVIGHILSLLSSCRNALVASTTCKKWREAWRSHMHSLSFNADDWCGYSRLPHIYSLKPVVYYLTNWMGSVISATIFQTSGLKCLSISLDCHKFSAVLVIEWLMHVKNTLLHLSLKIQTTPFGVESRRLKFPRLESCSLSHVSISQSYLNLLLAACPNIDKLSLGALDFVDAANTRELAITSPTLKYLHVDNIKLDKFVVDASHLEHLHVNDCHINFFELIGESSERLEVLDVKDSTTSTNLYHMISRSWKLKQLHLWKVEFIEDVVLEDDCALFPELRELSLFYNSRKNWCRNFPLASHDFPFEKVVKLVLGWSSDGSISADLELESDGSMSADLELELVAGFLNRCPNLKEFVLHQLSPFQRNNERRRLADFTSSIFKLMRKYVDAEVRFVYTD